MFKIIFLVFLSFVYLQGSILRDKLYYANKAQSCIKYLEDIKENSLNYSANMTLLNSRNTNIVELLSRCNKDFDKNDIEDLRKLESATIEMIETHQKLLDGDGGEESINNSCDGTGADPVSLGYLGVTRCKELFNKYTNIIDYRYDEIREHGQSALIGQYQNIIEKSNWLNYEMKKEAIKQQFKISNKLLSYKRVLNSQADGDISKTYHYWIAKNLEDNIYKNSLLESKIILKALQRADNDLNITDIDISNSYIDNHYNFTKEQTINQTSNLSLHQFLKWFIVENRLYEIIKDTIRVLNLIKQFHLESDYQDKKQIDYPISFNGSLLSSFFPFVIDNIKNLNTSNVGIKSVAGYNSNLIDWYMADYYTDNLFSKSTLSSQEIDKVKFLISIIFKKYIKDGFFIWNDDILVSGFEKPMLDRIALAKQTRLNIYNDIKQTAPTLGSKIFWYQPDGLGSYTIYENDKNISWSGLNAILDDFIYLDNNGTCVEDYTTGMCYKLK